MESTSMNVPASEHAGCGGRWLEHGGGLYRCSLCWKTSFDPKVSNAMAWTEMKAKTISDDMLAALRKFVAQVDFDIDGARIHPDPGCLECTSGTTPDRLNTGRCGYHAAIAAIAKAEGR